MSNPHPFIRGTRFGKLTTVRIAKSAREQRWLCLCDCGTEYICRAAHLVTGFSKSCGCNRFTHNKSHLSEYGIWNMMIRRCTVRSDKSFKNYGGRGIKVCDRWRTSFEHFLADMGERPSLRHQIERKNNNGNYEPENCCWIHHSLQARNRRSSSWLTSDGITLTIAEWSEKTNLSAATISGRISRGWPVDKAIKTPAAYRGPNKHQRRNPRLAAAMTPLFRGQL